VAAVTEIVVALPPGIGGAGRHHRRAAGAASARTRCGPRWPPRPGDDDVVVVHDAARPLVTPELVQACLDALGDADAAIAAAPVTDTIKECADGRVVRTLDRSRLWAVQTPQVFRRAALRARARSGPRAIGAATDDAALVEAMGGTVRVVPRRARTSRSRPSSTCAWPRCCCASAECRAAAPPVRQGGPLACVKRAGPVAGQRPQTPQSSV
jgi:hypothetical protein